MSYSLVKLFLRTVSGEKPENVFVPVFRFPMTMLEEWLNDLSIITTMCRLHSAIGYIAPVDKLNGREQEIFKERDQKLEKVRELRKKNDFVPTVQSIQGETTRLIVTP